MCDQQSLRSACAYAQSDQRLCKSLEYCQIVKVLTERHLEFPCLNGGCRGSSESSLVKMSYDKVRTTNATSEFSDETAPTSVHIDTHARSHAQ